MEGNAGLGYRCQQTAASRALGRRWFRHIAGVFLVVHTIPVANSRQLSCEGVVRLVWTQQYPREGVGRDRCSMVPSLCFHSHLHSTCGVSLFTSSSICRRSPLVS